MIKQEETMLADHNIATGLHSKDPGANRKCSYRDRCDGQSCWKKDCRKAFLRMGGNAQARHICNGCSSYAAISTGYQHTTNCVRIEYIQFYHGPDVTATLQKKKKKKTGGMAYDAWAMILGRLCYSDLLVKGF